MIFKLIWNFEFSLTPTKIIKVKKERHKAKPGSSQSFHIPVLSLSCACHYFLLYLANKMTFLWIFWFEKKDKGYSLRIPNVVNIQGSVGCDVCVVCLMLMYHFTSSPFSFHVLFLTLWCNWNFPFRLPSPLRMPASTINHQSFSSSRSGHIHCIISSNTHSIDRSSNNTNVHQ